MIYGLIHDYVAQDSPKYADRLMDKFIDRVAVLEKYPKIGRKVPEFDDESIRELVEGSYRIIYQIGIARVIILPDY